MARAQRAAIVDLPPLEAYELWTDVSRWQTFIDGFGHVDRKDDEWPADGAKLVWRSVPTGRGIVTERVQQAEPGVRFATQVIEERLIGSQTAEFTPAADDERATQVQLTLDYSLQSRNPLSILTDLLFIRRAQADALQRTLRRFATEAAEQAAL
jgi:ribosome-associated toxin RatA of RatAB toxin-antitoxin module